MYNPKLQNVTLKGTPMSVTMLGAGLGSRVARVRSGLQEGSMIYIPQIANQCSEAEKTGSSETCVFVCLGRIFPPVDGASCNHSCAIKQSII